MESFTDKEKVEIVRSLLSASEIEVLSKIYHWIKSEHYPVFFKHILKRIHNYTKALNRLKQKGLVYVIKSRDPWKITQDGVRVGGLILELEGLGLL